MAAAELGAVREAGSAEPTAVTLEGWMAATVVAAMAGLQVEMMEATVASEGATRAAVVRVVVVKVVAVVVVEAKVAAARAVETEEGRVEEAVAEAAQEERAVGTTAVIRAARTGEREARAVEG